MVPMGLPEQGSRAPEVFCMAEGDDDSPPTSPSNFNTIPLRMSDENQEARKDGLTAEELRDYEELQASFDQFKARQSEVEAHVASLLERLTRRVQVPSSAASSECGDWDNESLGPTEDGLSFLDSRLGSRVGTPLGGSSPLGSPRDKPTLPTDPFPKRPESSGAGFPEARSRFDGTAPGGGERGDLASRVATAREDASQTRQAKPATPATETEALPEQRAVKPSKEEPPVLREEAGEVPSSFTETQPLRLRDPHAQLDEPPQATLAAEMLQAQMAPGEDEKPEAKCSGGVEDGEVLPDSTSTASSPPRHPSSDLDKQRLPHFGSASMCDEETEPDLEGPEPPLGTEDVISGMSEFDSWHGWTVVATTEGRLFFFHEGMQLSQWHQPPELDPILGVWTEARDETQLTRPMFWRNDLLQISLWRDPRETSNIFQAAMDGNLFFLQLFSQVSDDLDCVDHRGCSALHYAAAGGSAPSALFLLQWNAMVDRADISLTTPLMLTCRYGYPVVLKVLLDAQADPCLADNNGQAPLHQAAELGQLDCIHLLLLCGAQVHQRNVHGETALDIAQRQRHIHCVTLLRRHRPPEGTRSISEGTPPPGHARRTLPPRVPDQVAELQQMKAEAWSADGGYNGAAQMPRDMRAAPWESTFQASPDGLGDYPSRYSSSAMPEADSSDNSEDPYAESGDRSPSQSWKRQSDDGLLGRLRRRLFPIRADLGLPNLYRFNAGTQRWELPPEWEAYLQPG